MSRSMFIAVILLAVELCMGEKACVIWSSAKNVVQRGHSFKVYCTSNDRYNCKVSMQDHPPPSQQKPNTFNSTTVFFNVFNITNDRTYSCECKGHYPPLDSCGLDIATGYPPDPPQNISCIYKIIRNESGDVVCTWNKGRDTFIRSSFVLWVRTVSGNRSEGPVSHTDSSKGTESPLISFAVSRSVQLISMWIQAQNLLDTVNSSIINYTLSDIAMPSTPVLGQPVCSSRKCVIKVEQSVITEYLEIQYRDEQETWTTYPDSTVQMSSSPVQSIHFLEPYRLYHFRARTRFSTGLWSQWSTKISSYTQEEAPAKALDVWLTEPESDFKSMRVYWKEPNISISRGKITGYKISFSPNSVINISADIRNVSVPFCVNCEVMVQARNSKGLSPPARIITHHTKGKPPQDVRATASNYNITISWKKPETAPLHYHSYVLEWYPMGHKLEELQWVRLGKDHNRAVISEIRPFKCYEGAVYVLYNDSSVSGTRFKGVATSESAPIAGPLVQEKVDGNRVKITWTELPTSQRGGCITMYNIYLENGSRRPKLFSDSIPASEKTYTIKDMSPGVYSLWMSASTARGEGPAGQKVKLFIEQETPLFLLLSCIVFLAFVLLVLCLWQSSAVKQRFLHLFHCLMLDVVPDPANSKWAKACTGEEGRMNLQLQLSNSTVTPEEEEPILVDVEELPKQNCDTYTPTNVSLQLPPQNSLSPETDPATLLYPHTTYIKSLSHDSDSSHHTQPSMDTITTVDYISSHECGDMDEEDEAEEEFVDIRFFPSHNIFTEPLEFGGKLTLDTVKIDCSDFFQNM